MPGSSYQGLDHYLLADLPLINPATAIDVGVGNGKVGRLIKSVRPNCQITGHEIFPTNITPALNQWYQQVIQGDFRQWLETNVDWTTDLIAFGDVLEHFSHSQAMDALDMCMYRAKWIALFTPLSYFQGTFYGNIHEAHRSVVPLQDLCRYNVIHYVKDIKVNIIYCLIKGML